MPRIFIIALIIAFLICKGAYSQTVLKSGVRVIAKEGKQFTVSINSPLNFYYSLVGDDVWATINEDISFGDNTYIPKGSLLKGLVTNIKAPKRFGQSGSFEIDFKEIILPNKTSIPIQASVSTDVTSKEKKISEILTYDAALVAYGTFHGLFAGIQYGGIPLAIATHGISVLAGGGIGAGAGIVGSIKRKGKMPIVFTGIQTKLSLKSDFYILDDLPEKNILKTTEENDYKGFRFNKAINKEDIEINLENVSEKKDKNYGRYLLIKITARNNSSIPISLSDFILKDESNLEFLNPDLLLSGLDALKTIKPSDGLTFSLGFLTSKKADKYFLVLIDQLDKKEIVKIPLK